MTFTRGRIKKEDNPALFVKQLQTIAEHARGAEYRAFGCIEFTIDGKAYYLIPLTKDSGMSVAYELLTQNEAGFFVGAPQEVLDDHNSEIEQP